MRKLLLTLACACFMMGCDLQQDAPKDDEGGKAPVEQDIPKDDVE